MQKIVLCYDSGNERRSLVNVVYFRDYRKGLIKPTSADVQRLASKLTKVKKIIFQNCSDSEILVWIKSVILLQKTSAMCIAGIDSIS